MKHTGASRENVIRGNEDALRFLIMRGEITSSLGSFQADNETQSMARLEQ